MCWYTFRTLQDSQWPGVRRILMGLASDLKIFIMRFWWFLVLLRGMVSIRSISDLTWTWPDLNLTRPELDNESPSKFGPLRGPLWSPPPRHPPRHPPRPPPTTLEVPLKISFKFLFWYPLEIPCFKCHLECQPECHPDCYPECHP